MSDYDWLEDNEEMDVTPKKRKCLVQSQFCLDLMERLYYDVSEADDSGEIISGYTRMINDIRYLRRELCTLSKMLQAGGKYANQRHN